MQAVLEKHLSPSWYEELKEEFEKPYMQALSKFLRAERARGVEVYPPAKDVFTAFELCPFDQVRVVVIGQDPYHGPGQAHGLCFSVQKGIAIPPSLKNIYLEMQADLGLNPPLHGCLHKWAKRGILLLNSTLTVRRGNPESHQRQGWEQFTDVVCQKLAQKKEPLVFMLWGKFAQEKAEKALGPKSPHLILKAAHPSPFSAHRGCLGCRHFSKANHFLKEQGRPPVDWELS
jgi:uracil-DNA glycosylase